MARPIKVITAGAEIRAELHRRANALTSAHRKSAKKRSTRFIHDEDVGVKCDVKRGWRASQARAALDKVEAA